MTGAPGVRLLADEGVPARVVSAVRADRFAVVWLAESSPGLSDEAALMMADAAQRLLMTADKDYLVFRGSRRITTGVMLVRTPVRQMPELVLSALHSRSDWGGNLVVVEPSRLRVTRFLRP